ncbi:hypothetical protein [Sediminibacillus albus]|uniref:Pre-peptidase C-terminal domain-containing protein n=1 Tax=Sediminibacillus albus TaxID=407036 RepID=A0A1G9B589_9BACI|nr:hypothetical protein [Sediminibacillus albus]SDK34659.1 hypothetical protein SAMN05216243_2817 [Sediminibacillus albus]
MKKLIFLLLVVIAIPSLLTVNTVLATEKADLSEVVFEDDLGKNENPSFVKPEGELEILNNKSGSVIKEGLNLESDHQRVTGQASIQASNDSPNTAALIEIGSVYSDYITEEGQQKWYRFENTDAGKLTVILQTVQSANVDYDLHLFKLNEETMTLEEEIISSYGSAKNEQLSKLSEGGVYYIAVNSAAGFDSESPFTFTVRHSPSFDQSEPDDNIWQAPAYLNNVYESQTLDNSFDMDWVLLELDEEKTLTVNLDNPATGNYQLDIFDPALNSLAGLEDNKNYSIVFPKGVYLLRVQSTSGDYDAEQSYTLDIRERAGEAKDAVISNIDTDDNVEGYLNYGYGNKWRIEHFMNVRGQLFDENGLSVPNTNVEVRIATVLNDRVYIESGTTDRNGNFEIEFPNIQEAVGEYGFNNNVSYHYFDIIPIVVLSNGKVVDSNEDSLYHFAYSVYQPH